MASDFKAWETPTDAQRAAIAAYDRASRASTPDLETQWADFGCRVANRFKDETYQRLVTYCLLAEVTPAVVGQIIRRYIENGILPWRS